MKKLVSVLLALVMCLSVTTFAWAEDTLPDGVAFEGANTVYWVSGEENGYAETLAAALKAAYMVNADDITMYCKPGADVGSMTHGHVADNLTIYGNNAYISGGECDLEVDTIKYSRTTGNPDDNGVYLEKSITIIASDLYNLGVWGERHTNHTVTIKLTNCDSKAMADSSKNLQRVYISGETGVNNIYLTGCDFLTKATAVYSNADGEIVIDGCTFNGCQAPVNINHKADGAQTVAVRGCTFTNCGDDDAWKEFGAPIRFVNSGNGTMTAEISGTTITGTVGSNGDILIGDGRDGKSSNPVGVSVSGTAGEIQVQQPGYYTDNGGKDESKLASATIGEGDRASVDGNGKITVIGPNTDPVDPDPTPVEPEQPAHTNRRYPATTTTTTETPAAGTDVTSAKTFDAGVALYVGMALTSTLGMAWAGKKRAQ